MASIPARIGLNFASQGASKLGHDLRAIGHDLRRSSVDRVPDALELSIDDRGMDSTWKALQSRLDRAAIAVRSDRDRGVLPRVAYAVRFESDAPDLLRKEKKDRPLRGR